MQFRTDLAVEEAERVGQNIQGVKTEKIKEGNIEIDVVNIVSPEGAMKMNKPMGKYVTVQLQPLSDSAMQSDEEIEAIAAQLSDLLPQKGNVLVIGLGNTEITPDNLGPKTAMGVLATRHLTGEVARSAGLDNLRGVAVLAPGVMGQTGIESVEIVSALCGQINPSAVIVIDALASRSTGRLGCTIQLADSGICPGAGVHNTRKEISRQTLGVPVISMGIPTVVDGATLAYDLIAEDNGNDPKLRQIFEPRGAKMMVTPREIDLIIERGARLASTVINSALQPDLTLDEISYLMN